MKLVDLLFMSEKKDSIVHEALTLNQDAVGSLIPRMKNVPEERRAKDLDDLIHLVNTFYKKKGYNIVIKNR